MKPNLLSELKDYEEQWGVLGSDAIARMAEKHGRSLAAVYSVSKFYSETASAKRGIFKINLCKSQPCRMKGSEDVLAALQDELRIDPGECTEDGTFSLHLVNCIGACDVAPAMLVNGDLYGNLSPGEMGNILKKLQRTLSGDAR